MVVVKYEITKNQISFTPLTNCSNKESGQKFIDYLSKKSTHGYKIVKKNKNNLTCKTQINSVGDIKYLYFTIITTNIIPTTPQKTIEIQKQMLNPLHNI